jgi:hypothetical protein
MASFDEEFNITALHMLMRRYRCLYSSNVVVGVNIVISFDELSMRSSILYAKRTQGNLKKMITNEVPWL